MVGPIGADLEVPSYAGFITVNERFNSNLFFWFVPSLRDPRNSPVVLWMQGGPGTSSLLGFFSEHGPYVLSPDGKKAQWRNLTWAQRYSMLYVDQPVGAGFSFTESNEGYARNMNDIARDMLEFVQQFFTLFSEQAKNDLYLAGESYAGKYVPAVGAALHESANNARVKVNFRGIAFGNGFTDPVNMIDFGEFLHNIGLMRRADALKVTEAGKSAVGLIRDGRLSDAAFLMDRTIFGLLTKDTFFKNVTGYDYYYNYLIDKQPRSLKSYEGFVTSPEIRRSIHVGHLEFHTSRTVVAEYLTEDIMRSAVKQFTVVLQKGYKVLVYSGNLDICVPTTQTERFLSKLKWSHADHWKQTPHHIWWSADGQSPLGYKKTIANLNFMAIRNGGHVLPFDQPVVMFDLITAFIDDTAPFGR
ncbi:hypothetical protein HPB48_001048 [Haemaphysalis longicornis]|uniref:Carboxypeptidase n=1 Tax=Haemaphysalis longicornis TaxID=44386 RepID=A0A9J6G0W8_HAELO|nr:hypothetical protein HPB48_001048 [Haemaphysalis longicornis]